MRVIVNPKYAHLQKEIEEIPRSFQEKGDVVYDGRNVLKRIGLGSIDVVVKSFKKPHIINRLYIRFSGNQKQNVPIFILWRSNSMVLTLRSQWL